MSRILRKFDFFFNYPSRLPNRIVQFMPVHPLTNTINDIKDDESPNDTHNIDLDN